MTAPDTKAIRAQMEALTGFTAGPWNADLGETYRVKADGMNIATANFVTLLDRIPTDQVRQNARLIAAAPDMHATILALCDALDTEQSKVRRMGREVNHAKYGQPDFAWGIHLETTAELNAENERLREALTKINVGDGWAAQIARAALAQKGGE